MRLIVFFDLPVMTRQERKAAASFRNFLLKDGYYMIQFSVYGRLCNGTDSIAKFEARLAANLPISGSIRTMSVTEKQYAGMRLLSGKKKEREKPFAEYQMSFF